MTSMEGWTLLEPNDWLPEALKAKDREKVVDVGGNTVVKIWTVVENVPSKTERKSVEIIVRHDEAGVTHQLYFRVLLGGTEWADGENRPFLRVHSLDGMCLNRNAVVDQQEGETQGVMEDVYECKNLDMKHYDY